MEKGLKPSQRLTDDEFLQLQVKITLSAWKG